MKIGLLREHKSTPDTRVPLTPAQCRELSNLYPNVTLKVQASPYRCFSNAEYRDQGIEVVESMEDCDVLMGVKEVPVERLIAGKTYLFFSHTIKAQPHNRKLLQEVLQKGIRLVDYECMTDVRGVRVIAFGRWAGIVGAHNGLRAYGKRTGLYVLPAVHSLKDYQALKELYAEMRLPPMRIVVTGTGRVARGAVEVLDHLRIRHLEPQEFLSTYHAGPVYTQLFNHHMYQRREGGGFHREEFFEHPELYESCFAPYTRKSELMVNCIYWNPEAPRFFSLKDMAEDQFRIRTIADISCDINGSVPATTRVTTIADPVMGYDPKTRKEAPPYGPDTIDIMAVDNLPNELPRDASEDFGNMLIDHVWEELLRGGGRMMDAATIARGGRLTEGFGYLDGFVG